MARSVRRQYSVAVASVERLQKDTLDVSVCELIIDGEPLGGVPVPYQTQYSSAAMKGGD